MPAIIVPPPSANGTAVAPPEVVARPADAVADVDEGSSLLGGQGYDEDSEVAIPPSVTSQAGGPIPSLRCLFVVEPIICSQQWQLRMCVQSFARSRLDIVRVANWSQISAPAADLLVDPFAEAPAPVPTPVEADGQQALRAPAAPSLSDPMADLLSLGHALMQLQEPTSVPVRTARPCRAGSQRAETTYTMVCWCPRLRQNACRFKL